MTIPKKVKMNSRVQIIKPVGYIQGCYANRIGEIVEIKGEDTLVIYDDGIKLVVLLANLKVI